MGLLYSKVDVSPSRLLPVSFLYSDLQLGGGIYFFPDCAILIYNMISNEGIK